MHAAEMIGKTGKKFGKERNERLKGIQGIPSRFSKTQPPPLRLSWSWREIREGVPLETILQVNWLQPCYVLLDICHPYLLAASPTISLVYPGPTELISSPWGIRPPLSVVFRTLTGEKSFAGRTGRGVDISGARRARFINTRASPVPSPACIRKTLGRRTRWRARII